MQKQNAEIYKYKIKNTDWWKHSFYCIIEKYKMQKYKNTKCRYSKIQKLNAEIWKYKIQKLKISQHPIHFPQNNLNSQPIRGPFFAAVKNNIWRVLRNQIPIENDDDDNGDNFDAWWWQCPKIFKYHYFLVKIYPF